MVGRMPKIALACLVSIWGTNAYACLPPERPASWFDQAIKIAKDGSFTKAEDNFYSSYQGMAVLDLGSGKFGQRLRHGDFCSYFERLLVVDCEATQLIVIDGRVNPKKPDDFGGGPSSVVKMLYPPNGKVRLNEKTTIAGLVALSKAEGYDYQTDVQAAFGGGKKKNRYNPFNGCKLFYPDSAGAKQ
jgi:hypothetical protein